MPACPLVLGIETSCDDTACAVVDGGGRVLASVVASQLAAHRPYGGVVPEIASREHLANWPAVYAAALAAAGCAIGDIEAVAATRGPGLVGALLVGLSLGKAIAYARGLPFHAVHHLEGHLHSPFLCRDGEAAEEEPERFVGLVLSGGHSGLFAVEGGVATTLGEARDDAMGEVFDKVGKRIGLAYPQGPRVDELAEGGRAERLRFPVPDCGPASLDFSYSGLKSQALQAIERLEARLGRLDDGAWVGGGEAPPRQEVLDLLAGFRAAAVGQVLARLDLLADGSAGRGAFGGFGKPGLLAVSGGAAANRLLRRELPPWAERRGLALRLVPLVYSGDNAAMIANAARLRQARGLTDDPLTAEAASRIPL